MRRRRKRRRRRRRRRKGRRRTSDVAVEFALLLVEVPLPLLHIFFRRHSLSKEESA